MSSSLARLGVIALGVVAFSGAARVQAQGPGQPPAAAATSKIEFEVASVKRNKMAEADRAALPPGFPAVPGRAQTLRGGLLRGRGMSVRELIRDAYGYRNRPQSDIIGAPDWIDNERYDIEAKAADVNFPASTSVGLPPLGEIALQTLLAERFNLKAHMETRRRPIYEMVLNRTDGKLGPNLVPAKGGCIPFFKREAVNVGLTLDQPKAGDAEPLPPCLAAVGSLMIAMDNTELSDWVKILGLRPQLNRPVVDKTGLTGNYDIVLRYPDPEPGAPYLLPAIKPLIEAQHGLTLRDAEAPIEVLIIDRIDHPTEN